MGAAATKRRLAVSDILETFERQKNLDVVQYPEQETGSQVFKGTSEQQKKEAIALWDEMGDPNKELWIYQTDSIWWRSHWITKGENKVLRHQWILKCRLNQLAKDVWAETMKHWGDETSLAYLDIARQGEWGQCNYWWQRRFASTQAVKLSPKSNFIDYFPMVLVVKQGEITEQFVDLADFEFKAEIDIRNIAIPDTIPIEDEIFKQIITCEVLK